jgi:myosin V
LLDEQFMMQASGNDTNLLKNCNTMLSSNRSYKRPDKLGAQQFIVAHYAGNVTYDIDGFVEKNKDSVSSLISDCLAKSKNNIVGFIFNDILLKEYGQSGGLKGNSLSNQFRAQLTKLITTLKKSAPRYVRCIKPNSKFSPDQFDSWDVCK